MKKVSETEKEYYKMLTRFVSATIREWEDKDFTGNMLITFTEGVVTNFKPSLVYGASNTPAMYNVFNGK